MPDKKLTDVTDNNVGKMNDNEIKKALEEKIKFQEFDESECAVIKFETLKNILDLINRLQAELKENENIIRLADKTIETANAEIERLQGDVDRYSIQVANQREQIDKYEPIKETLCVLWETMSSIGVAKGKEKPTLEELAEAVDHIKTEAYKECIEKVKGEIAEALKSNYKDELLTMKMKVICL